MSSKYINWNDINDDDSEQEVDSSSIEEEVVNTSIKRTESTPAPVQGNQANIEQNLNKLRNYKGNAVWLYSPAFKLDKFAQSEKELRNAIEISDKSIYGIKTGWNISVDRQKAQKLIITGLRTENFIYKFYFSNRNQQNLQRKYSNQQTTNSNPKKYREKKEDLGTKINTQREEQKGNGVKSSNKYKETITEVDQAPKEENKVQEKIEEEPKPKKKKYVAKKKEEILTIKQQNQTQEVKDKNNTANYIEKIEKQNEQVNGLKKEEVMQQNNQKLKQEGQSIEKNQQIKEVYLQVQSSQKEDHKKEDTKQQPKDSTVINEQKVEQDEEQNEQENIQKLKKQLKKKNKKNKPKKKQVNDLGNNRFAALAIN